MSLSEALAPRPIVFELCCETLEATLAARPGGAARIELCTHLAVGGLTPPPQLTAAAVAKAGLPVHVLVRPTAETFAYSPELFRALCEQIAEAKELGAAGVVVGLLHADSTVDVEHTRALVELASPLPVTFHRAFDTVPDQFAALEAVISTGCARILTSGGASDVLRGAHQLARLIQKAGTRIEIAAGGGLRLANAREVAFTTRARHFHGSLLLPEPGAPPTLEARVRNLLHILTHSTPHAGLVP